ncbi:hypothetical protein N474_02135 [Pseudoalteromonas luteoviolacea CPMOR-2]|uniref:DUF4440 domain-containing protein n=1 Tax=Pseudoalteromonas luteoviolacea DSM 6061 TaxID=1365250 RepID=A0A166V3Y0_9GAMM|nr:hypothetical protein [Pseudoalteromonas luteoviolacea]KZN31684.1 hypothetical protein N475_04315 [Pseudoalteromonas luteoviolacea DSM 6061]KZN54544.1 hypothetical protein N474_02135 [Pseudoalteromonas luteoviolacea CPMOR-2]MBE0389020.1 hypothetical protein [Pseudoalteromonas luteoviolacea DSM 6061]
MRLLPCIFMVAISFNSVASSPQQTVADLWQALSHDKNSKPNINKLKQLLHPEAKVFGIHFKNEKHSLMAKSGGEFIELLDKASKRGFYECEIVRNAKVYDHFAHVYSVVETRFDMIHKQPAFTGVNSIQLIKSDGRWQIISLYYQVENPNKGIPLEGGISGRCL